jgi:hypothetical protein
MIDAFISGAVMLGSAAVGLIFLRSWNRTGDRLFLLFALAFWLFGLERWLLLMVSSESPELRSWVYLVRLVAFALIIVAVIDKNRRRPGH